MLTAHAKPLDWDTDYQTFFDGMKDNFSKDMLLRRASTVGAFQIGETRALILLSRHAIVSASGYCNLLNIRASR